MKYKRDQELMDYLKSEIQNLEKAIEKANLNNNYERAEYYEGMKAAYKSGLEKLMSEQQ